MKLGLEEFRALRRSRAAARPRVVRPFTAAELEEAARRFLAGEAVRAIARRIGRHPSAVVLCLTREDLRREAALADEDDLRERGEPFAPLPPHYHPVLDGEESA